VRSFAAFTQDLYLLADWLSQCGIKTVAMESTGVYWIPLFQILKQRGLEVCPVNARHVKNVPGRRTGVCDCQWLRFLHSAGLLRASYRPVRRLHLHGGHHPRRQRPSAGARSARAGDLQPDQGV
jgi:transposase